MKAAEALQAPLRGAEVWPLSVSDYDRSKLRAYASAGVKECWLVLGREKQIEVHRQPGEVEFAERTLHGPGGRLTSTAIPSFTVDLSRLFEPV